MPGVFRRASQSRVRRAAIAVAALSKASGGTNTPMTITATQTQSTSSGPSIANGVGLSATQNQNPSRIRSLGGTKSATEAQTATRLRLVAPVAKTATNAQTPSLVKGQSYLKTLTVTIVQTAALV